MRLQKKFKKLDFGVIFGENLAKYNFSNFLTCRSDSSYESKHEIARMSFDYDPSVTTSH